MPYLGSDYNPKPPREWYRFENQCAYSNAPIQIQNGQAYLLDVLKKGNVLQYKNNSSNITKQQRYAQIARGMWTNRTTTWASQTQSYTNPNTGSLKRVGYNKINTKNPIAVLNLTGRGENIVNNAVFFLLQDTDAPLTCPSNVINTYYSLPTNDGGSGTIGPDPPPVVPPLYKPPIKVGGVDPVMPPIYTVNTTPDANVIPDGGTLICNISENICTGEIYSITKNQNCFPTTDSDVPGPIMYLCYTDGLPTYYPRVRRTYATSGSKWPQGAKDIFAASAQIPCNDVVSQTNIIPIEPIPPGVVVQYIYANTSFEDYLVATPSSNNPYPGLPTLTCYDGSIQGFVSSITPHDAKNQIKVQFKVKYQTSDVFETRLTMGIVYTINNGATYSLLGQDTFFGSVNAGGPLSNVYTFNYMHSPNTINKITYKLFFQLENNTENLLGLIGNANSSSDCIILEEYTTLGYTRQKTGENSTGKVIQYTYANNSFTDYLIDTPSSNAPYPGLPTVICYDASTRGFFSSITPHNYKNQIKVELKVKYQSSDVFETRLTIGVVYTINNGLTYSLLGQDTFFGSVNAGGPLVNIYTFNYMHSPNTAGNITYKLFFQLEGNTENLLGLIGNSNSSSDCISLSEYSSLTCMPQNKGTNTIGTVIQYSYVNSSFSNYLTTSPSITRPYSGLTTLYCYDAGSQGYLGNIMPQSVNNQIKVQFKVKYKASDVFETRITMGVVYTTDGGYSYSIVGQDTFAGSVNAGGPIYDVYMFNYTHLPNTVNNIIYKMFFQLDNSSIDPLGLIGDLTASNCIILEEFAITNP